MNKKRELHTKSAYFHLSSINGFLGGSFTYRQVHCRPPSSKEMLILQKNMARCLRMGLYSQRHSTWSKPYSKHWESLLWSEQNPHQVMQDLHWSSTGWGEPFRTHIQHICGVIFKLSSKISQNFPSLLYLNNDKRCFHSILSIWEKKFMHDSVTYKDAVKTILLYLLKKNNDNNKKNHNEQTVLTGRANWHIWFSSHFHYFSKKKKKTTISAQINSFACLLHIPKALKQRNRVVVSRTCSI